MNQKPWSLLRQTEAIDTMYHRRVNDLTAFVLAGGKSRRMGRDKALLRLAEETLLERARNLARSVTRDVRVVGAPREMNEPVIEDVYLNRGPLGGIHAALARTETEFNFIVAVDTPFIETTFLKFLISEARSSGAVVTVPRTAGYLHPLCAVYRREFVTVSEKALIRGQNKIDILFAFVPTKVIEEEEITSRGFCSRMFRNLNTPEEWEDAQASSRQYKRVGESFLRSKRTR